MAEAREGQADGAARERGAGRRALRIAGILATSLLVVLVAFVALLQFEGITTRLVNAAASRFAPWASVRVERADLDGLTDLTASGIHIRDAEGDTLVRVDSLDVGIRLLPLLRRRLAVPRLRVADASIRMEQARDSTWDLLLPLASPDTVRARPGAPWSIRVGRAQVVRSSFEASFAAATDSVLRVEDITLEAADVMLGDVLSLELDTLGARILPPGRQASPARLAASASLGEGRLVTRGITLRSAASDVRAEGELLLPGGAVEEVEEIDFTIAARPLDFRDIGALVPGFDTPGSLRLDGRVTGSSSALHIAVEGETSDGARLDVQGMFTPRTEGPVRYALSARFEDLDPGLVMEGGSSIDDVDGDLEIALAGPVLERMNGTVSGTVSARLADGRLRPTSIDVEFDDGVARVAAEGAATPWAAIRLSGTITPLGAEPSWDLELDARQLDRVVAGGVRVGGVRAAVRTQGSGLSALETRGSAHLTLNGIIGDARLTNGSANVEWAAGRATADLRLPVEAGHLAGTTRIDWSGDATRIEVPALHAERLDLARVLGDTVRGSVTAEVRGSGELGRPDALEGRVAAVLERAAWGELVVDTGRVEATADDGVIAVEGRLVAPSGRVRLDARLRPFAEPARWNVRELVVENLDLAGVRAGLPASDIDAHLTGEFRGTGTRTLAGDATLTTAGSTFAGRRVDSLRVDVSVRDGDISADGTARIAGGGIAFDATLQPFAGAPAVRVDEATFQDIALDSLAGPRFAASLTGSLRAEAMFPPDTFPRASGTLELSAGPFNAGRLEGGRIEFALADGRATLDGVLRTARGEIDIDGGATLARGAGGDTGESELRIAEGHVEGVVRLPDIAALAGVDTVDAELTARFSGSTRAADSAGWSLRVAAQGGYEDLRVDTLRVAGRWAGGLLHVDTLRLESNAVRGGGGGVVALGEGARATGDTLVITLRADTVSALAPLLGGGILTARSGVLTAEAVGTEQGARIDAQLAVGGFIRGTISTDTATIDVRARIADGELRTATADLRARTAAAGTIVLDEARASVNYDSAGAEFTVTARPGEGRSLRVAGVARPDSQWVLLRQVEGRIDERLWTLDEAARITWGERIAIDDLRLTAETRAITVDGHIDRAGTQDLTARLDSVPLEDFANLAGMRGLTGVLSGRVRLDGPADAVAVDGEIRGSIGAAEIAATLQTRSGERRLAIDATLEDGDADLLRIGGTVPFVLSLAPAGGAGTMPPGSVDLTITADSFDIGWATPLVRRAGLSRVAGMFGADVRVTGTRESPSLDGVARIRSARFVMPSQGIDYHDVGGAFTLEGRSIRIDTLRAESDGTAVVDGRVTFESLSEPQLALDVELDQFHLITNRWTRLVASGSADVEGTPLAPQVTGDILLIGTDIYGDAAGGGEVAQVELTERDFEMLASYFGYTPSRAAVTEEDRLEPLGLDLAVELGPDVWLRRESQPELRVLLDGSLDVRKAPGDSIRLFGTIEAVPERSTFEQFGRRFEVTEGTITFNGPMMGWNASISAVYEVPSFQDPTASEVDITVAVSGGMDNLGLTLGSEPSMETADILSYLATGRPAASAIEFGGGEGDGGGLLGRGAQVALGSATTALENLAADAVGLSVVEVQQTAQGSRLVAGRYVTPRFFVGFQQPLTMQDEQEGVRNEPFGTEIELEYAAYRWLLVNLQGGSSQFRGFFRFKHAF